MEDYNILIKKGYKYIQFKNIDKFNKYRHPTIGNYFYEDLYYTIKDSKYSQWNTYDTLGNTIDASQIEEKSKLNLECVLKIMESKE